MDKAVEAAGKAAIAAQKDFEKLAEPEGVRRVECRLLEGRRRRRLATRAY